MLKTESNYSVDLSAIEMGNGLDALYRRIGFRLLPVLFLGYLFAYLNRINVGFAALQMKHDLGFTDAVYGLGAGVFFISYILCEVPSNLLLQRLGARLTITCIMVCWGITSCSTMLVGSPVAFYAMRVLLGVFEAGFAPGVMLYLTYWYVDFHRILTHGGCGHFPGLIYVVSPRLSRYSMGLR